MRTTGLTYADLLELFPEESLDRHELIGGALHVTPSPARRHQRVVARLSAALESYTRAHGGEVLPGPFDLRLGPHDVVQPDLMFFVEDRRELIGERPTEAVPDVVVEISSPATRARDLTAKRALYERHGVPEYWFVDLDRDVVLLYRLGSYDDPVARAAPETLRSEVLPGLAIPAGDLLSPG